MFHVCVDLAGQKFGRLTALYRVGSSADGHAVWKCLCDCGNITTVQSNNLKNKKVNTVSCGCFIVERASLLNLTHGMTETKEYNAWQGMLSRCYYPSNSSYADYGGRGIMVCGRWLKSFENFFDDLGPAPAKRYSIERIDNDGNYEPKNCKWATAKEQRANQRPRRLKSKV